uniref:NAC domain-containing protein n=1 Tax=Physcomitrium patens TaxID=3218 RepID=A0A2K1J8F3_PHYPA|nr:hypothetical protein PHYPA_020913 [Physcomitrium patens]
MSCILLPHKHSCPLLRILVFSEGLSINPTPLRSISLVSWNIHNYVRTLRSERNLHLVMQLDDWVLCRIYEKTTHAQRAGKEQENSCVEEVLASLPNSIDDSRLALPHLNTSNGSLEFAVQQEALVDSLLVENSSENGCLSASFDSLQRETMSNNPGVSVQDLQNLTNEWKLQQSMATDHDNLERSRLMEQLASVPSVHRLAVSTQPMADGGMAQFQHPPRSYTFGQRNCQEKPMPAGRSASDDEVQSMFRATAMGFTNTGSSNAHGLESMFSGMGYEAQPNLSCGRPGGLENWAYPIMPSQPRMDFNFNYAPKSTFN